MRNPLECRADIVDRCRIPGEFPAFAQPLTKARVFTAKSFRFRRSLDQVKKTLGLERLFDEIHRPPADCADRRVDIAMSGKDDDG